MASGQDDREFGSSALTHVGADGEARMVDVSEKAATARVAVAEGRVRMAVATLERSSPATRRRAT